MTQERPIELQVRSAPTARLFVGRPLTVGGAAPADVHPASDDDDDEEEE